MTGGGWLVGSGPASADFGCFPHDRYNRYSWCVVAIWSGARNLLHLVWERWKVVAHVIGNFQARVLLTVFYFLIVPPFALVVKLAKDPMGLRVPQIGRAHV